MKIQIDKNIAIPVKLKYPFNEMEVGDSFYGEGEVRTKLSTAAYLWCKKNNNDWKFITRRYENGYRVWRTK